MYQQIYYSIELTRKLELLSKNYFLKERESEEHLPSCFALTDFGEEEEIVFFIFCTIQNPYFTLVRTTNNMLYDLWIMKKCKILCRPAIVGDYFKNGLILAI